MTYNDIPPANSPKISRDMCTEIVKYKYTYLTDAYSHIGEISDDFDILVLTSEAEDFVYKKYRIEDEDLIGAAKYYTNDSTIQHYLKVLSQFPN